MENSQKRTVIESKNGQDIHIRLLSAIDVFTLQNFNDNLSEQTRSQFLPHKYDDRIILKFIERNKKKTDRIYVALVKDVIVGYFFLWEFIKPFPILGIGISDPYQGQGLGKQMIAILIEDAEANGNNGILLTTLLTNEAAFQLYLKMGFKYLGDTDNIAGDGRITRERMMYLPIKEHVAPESHDFKPPVM